MPVLTESEDRLGSVEAIQSDKPTSNLTLTTRRRKVFLRLGLLGALALLTGAIWWLYNMDKQETDDAYVDSHISNIGCKISGTVANVFVTDNQFVKAGDPLVQLDPIDYQVKVEQARAALEQMEHSAKAASSKVGQSDLSAQGLTTQATGDLFSMQAQIASTKSALIQAHAQTQQAQARVKELEAQLRFAEIDHDRYKKVYEHRAVTKQQFEKSKETLEIAYAQQQAAEQTWQASQEKELQVKADLEDAKGRLAKSKGGMTTALATLHQKEIDQEQYAGSLAAVRKSRADLKQAETQLSYTLIRAAVNGRIGRKNAEIGQHVEAGQLLMSLVQDNPWVTANFKETQLGKMRAGQLAEIKIDSLSGLSFKGSVDSIAPASGAKFSILPPDNASGNFTKVVQRVPVKVLFNQKSLTSLKQSISPGMSCVVTVFTK